MDHLQKALAFAKDQGLTTDLRGRMLSTPTVVVTYAPEVWASTSFDSPTIVTTTILGITPEVGQLTTETTNFSIREPLTSTSPVKRNHGEGSSTSLEGGSPKWTLMS